MDKDTKRIVEIIVMDELYYCVLLLVMCALCFGLGMIAGILYSELI